MAAAKKEIRIGEVLKRARERKKLSADVVAAACNVTRSRYYQWEASDYILRKNFEALSAALDIPIKHLTRANGVRARIAA